MLATEFWCTKCVAETIWVLADQLAHFLGISHRSIYRWLTNGLVHSRRLA